MRKVITPAILLLSLVSMFNDISSEMLYPVMPVFLQSVGFSTILIGLLEGFAEAVSGFSKIYFGRMSDVYQRRMPFVSIGYLLSAFSKPMMVLFTSVPWIFSARTLDRLGKGVRTSARDAMLSDEASNEHKGKVFGFHRALDTVGAALGPLVALVYLHFHPENYRALFLIAFAPALVSVLLTMLIKEKKKLMDVSVPQLSLAKKLFYWTTAPRSFRKMMIGLLFFGLMNSSDVFLLLKAKQVTGSDELVLLVYVFYNLVFAMFAFPLGKMSDKIGMRKLIVVGLLLFAAVYAGMSKVDESWMLIVLFFGYGIYAAATEGISKALISNVVPKTETATAIGFYTGWNSICVLVASSVTGWIWYAYSPATAFIISAMGALLAGIYFLTQHFSEKHQP